jgi:hypothetical protein
MMINPSIEPNDGQKYDRLWFANAKIHANPEYDRSFSKGAQINMIASL